MCAASMIYDHFNEKWQDRLWNPAFVPVLPSVVPTVPVVVPPSEEEIADFRKLLERAREYDRKHAQPDCEIEEKRKKIKELADALGVEIEFA